MRFLHRFVLAAAAWLAWPGAAQAVEFHVFGDVSLESGDLEHDKVQFVLGELDLFASYEVSDRTTAFLELVFEDPGEGFVTDVERMMIQRRFSDAFKLGAGRMHTPLGFWNYNYHHGALIQDTISRPFFLSFEEQHEGVFPLHLVGAIAEGEFFAGNDGGAWQYQLAVGNGPSINTEIPAGGWDPDHGAEQESSNVVDFNNDKVFMGRLAYANFARGHHLGVFALRNDIVEGGSVTAADNFSERARGEKLFHQEIAGVDGRLTLGPVYFMGEYFLARTTDNIPNPLITSDPPGTHYSRAYYAQASWRMASRYTVTFRHEANQFAAEDSYYRLLALEEEVQHILALRYDIEESNALRLEVSHEEGDHGASLGVALQWFFLLY